MHNVSNADRDVLAHVNVQKLVRTVGIGGWAEHTGDNELRLREALAKHSHEWNRTTLAEEAVRLGEGGLRSLANRCIEPRSQSRAFPTATSLFELERHLGTVRRVLFGLHCTLCGWRQCGASQEGLLCCWVNHTDSSSSLSFWPAVGASTLGGSRSESLILVLVRRTLPAELSAGMPPTPVYARAGRHVRLRISSTSATSPGPAFSTNGNCTTRNKINHHGDAMPRGLQG
jgi:hypothetical protein